MVDDGGVDRHVDATGNWWVLDPARLQQLLELAGSGREVVGPRVADGVIGWAPLTSVDQLPRGVHDEQGPGRYRLVTDDGDESRFGWAVGPQTSKPVLHPPATPVWSIRRDEAGRMHVTMADHPVVATTLFGMRPCEVAAMAKLDRVLAGGAHPDPVAVAARADRLVVAVECTRPAATCFCASMGTGPGCTSGADVVLTELVDDGGAVRYLATALTDRGERLLVELDAPRADDDVRSAARTAVDDAARAQTRHVDRDGIASVLRHGAELARWDDVADRCLTCGNCTSVCPTCFCTDVHDTTSLDGDEALRTRHWDTCFSLQFSRIAGHSVRSSVRSRYRQWLTHKLGTWWDQFGESGCVGCGRCITWCPVGIDLTAEAAALTDQARDAATAGGAS